MNLASYILGILAPLLTLGMVFEMLRRRTLRERHAFWWLIAGSLALTIGIFPNVLTWASSLIGISIPTNLVFFVSIAVLFLVCLQNSSELTKLESETRSLAETAAILQLRVDELDERVKAKGCS